MANARPDVYEASHGQAEKKEYHTEAQNSSEMVVVVAAKWTRGEEQVSRCSR